MLKFSKMLPNKVYRVGDKFTLPYDQKAQLKGNLIAVFGESIEDTPMFFTNQYWQFKRYTRYYIERRLNEIIGNVNVREINDQRFIFNQGFGSTNPDMHLAVSPTMCKDYNMIYEINQYLNLVYNSPRINSKSIYMQKDMKMDLLVSKLKSLSKAFPNQKNKYLIIPVDKYTDAPRETTLWTRKINLSNPLVQLVRRIGDNPSEFASLKDWTFIFSNINEVFFIECKNINTESINDIKLLFKKFRSRKMSIYLNDLDDEKLGTTEDDNEDNIDEANKDTLVKTTVDVISTVNSLPLKDDEKEKLKKSAVSDIKKVYIDNKSKSVEISKKESKTIENKIDLTKNMITSNNNNDDNIDLSTSRKISDKKLLSKEDLQLDAQKRIKDELAKTVVPSQQSIKRLARVKKIQDEMNDIKIDNTTIEDLAVKAKRKQIEEKHLKADVINENMKNITFNNFEKGYNENLYDYDLTNILMSLSKKDKPLYLISLDKEDTSTTTNKIFTYKATFEDERGSRHILTFNMPKFIDNKFIHMNGSDKLFINQIIPLPVTKVSPDEVQVSSNYNKVFIKRFGKNVSMKISRFHKIVPELNNKDILISKGNNIQENISYMTTIEYDELSSKYSTITLQHDGIVLYFNQDEIRRIVQNYDLKFDSDKELPFGIQDLPNGERKLICIDINKDTITDTDLSPIDFIISKLSEVIPSFKNNFNRLNVGKKYIYTRATIMTKKVPMILLLAFLDGLEPLLNRMNINYEFSEKRPQLRDNSSEKAIVQFKDGYFVYNTNPFSNALLLNGLHDIPTEEYNFIDFSSKDIYYDIFTKLFGRRNIGNAFENFNQLFIDPITKEILEDYNLPTNFIDLMIYANSLLENNTFDLDGDLKNYRIRSNELVNAHLYKIIAKAYEKYRVTADNKKPIKLSIKKDEVINDMFNSQVMEEYSTLNPIYEIDRMRATSYKGPGGCNVDRAFNIEKRAYNESMMGILAQSSPISSNIGIARVMSLNPNIKSLRGYIEPGSKETAKNLDMTKMLSGAEMLVPMTATHDDAQRVSMTSVQSRHTISTMDSDSPLFGYGADKILAKTISNRFAYKAKEDGVITEYNEKLGYLIVEYKSGKREAIDLSNKQALNTGSGFYINNKLSPVFTEIGKKFKSGDVLAMNKDFFQYDSISGDVVYTSGPLARVAVIHGSCVFEDSTLVTERLAERLSSKITEKKVICIGKNSNIYHMVKIGDEVKVGDPLLVFDESYKDDYLNKLLAKMNEKEKDDIINAGRTPIKSKVNGTVIGIKIYYTVPKDDLSQSLQKMITDYERPIKQRIKDFTANGINIKDLTSMNDLPELTEPVNDKIKGVKLNGNELLIEFYIQTIDKFSVGDKLTFSTALKGVNQSLIPLGKEPYLVSDPSIKIDAFMSVSGYYSRMTNSFALALALNNVLIGAEKKIADILKK